MMTTNQIIEEYHKKYLNSANYGEGKIMEICVNCLSLAETWKHNSKAVGNLTLTTYDGSDVQIDSTYGNSWDTIPVELMNICINRRDVSAVRVFSYEKENNKPKSVLIGTLYVG